MTGSKSPAPYILKGCHTTELPESTHQQKLIVSSVPKLLPLQYINIQEAGMVLH